MRSLLVAVALTALLTGCGASTVEAPSDEASSEPEQDSELKESSIKLKDGREVVCVVYEDGHYEQGGVSCDWETANQPR